VRRLNEKTAIGEYEKFHRNGTTASISFLEWLKREQIKIVDIDDKAQFWIKPN